jgi:YjbE family integral membrane protein
VRDATPRPPQGWRAIEREEHPVGSLAQMMDPHAWANMFTSGWSEMDQPSFWVAVVKIMWINVLLSGDNAVVIAMACLGLPQRQRLWGMVFGAGVAVVLRIVFTVVIAQLMMLPYLKIVGGIALFYIAAKLLVPEDEDDGGVEAVDHLWRAVRIIAVADLVMSLDNVIAIAAAAANNFALILIGLGISVPLIVVGAALIMALLEKFPILVWAGAALLGWIVGEVISTDPAILGYLVAKFGESGAYNIETASAVVGAILVVLVGGLWRRSKLANANKVPAAE